MHDQNSIDKNETPSQKYDRALALFTESVLKPDHDLRGCAHNQNCYDELMEIREHVLEYLKTLKEVTYHTNPDESDELETEKLADVKALSKWRGVKLNFVNIEYFEKQKMLYSMIYQLKNLTHLTS